MNEPLPRKPGEGNESAESQPLIPFTPVSVRHRRDGWTLDKQCAFIEALVETGIVEVACRRVGMSRTSADKLRRRSDGADFRRAWQIAVDYAAYRIEEGAHHRSRHGVARPIFYKGEQVGEYRHYDERLTMFLLRSYRPERYGKPLDLPLAPLSQDELEERRMDREDPGIALDGGLTDIEFCAEDVPLDDDLDDDDADDDEAPCAL